MRIADRCICCESDNLTSSPAVLAPFISTRTFGWRPTEITAEWGLRDLRQGWSYALCNTFECRGCGHVFLDMRFEDEEMGRLYRDYRGEGYTRLRDEFEPGYRARNEMLVGGDAHILVIEDFLRPLVPARPKILDWGGDTGLNTPLKGAAAAHDVFDITDKQLVPGARRVAKDEATEENYDLIICSNVLEHLPYPRPALEEIAALAKRNTIFYVEVPYEPLMFANAGTVGVGSQKRLWHEHINFFSEASLRRLMESAGFVIVEQKTLEYARPERLWRAFGVAARRA